MYKIVIRETFSMTDRARRLVLAADADRRRIERELHDGLQQDLVAIVVNLQLARRLLDTTPAGAAALLDDIRRDTQAALDATRELALRIYPPLLDSAGMRAALRASAPETTIEIALGRCPEEVAACVYFCCLELLPGASAITVREDGRTVKFDVVVSNTPTGVSRVKDRIQAFGGHLTMEPGRISGAVPF
jgi:signal transduction histidine kinase